MSREEYGRLLSAISGLRGEEKTRYILENVRFLDVPLDILRYADLSATELDALLSRLPVTELAMLCSRHPADAFLWNENAQALFAAPEQRREQMRGEEPREIRDLAARMTFGSE